MSKQVDRPVPPSHKAILNHWIDIKHEEMLGWWVYDNIAECSLGYTFCWSCGIRKSKLTSLDRCHIVPFALGGSNEPSNFFLMCNDCHILSPDTSIPKIFFKWLVNKESYESERTKELTAVVQPYLDRITSENENDILDKLRETIRSSAGTHAGKFSRASQDGILAHVLEEIFD